MLQLLKVLTSIFQKKLFMILKKHFLEKFSDPDRIESDILLFQNPFNCNPNDAPVELQLELIDLQENDLLKEKHRKEKLLNFTATYLKKSFRN